MVVLTGDRRGRRAAAAAQLDGGLRRVLEPVQEELLEVTSRFLRVGGLRTRTLFRMCCGRRRSPLPSVGRLGGCWTPAAGGQVLKSGVTFCVGRLAERRSSCSRNINLRR